LIKALQYLLRAHGFSVEPGGSFDAATDAAVRDFQGKQGFTVDGEVGNQTWPALVIPVRPGDQGDAVLAMQAACPVRTTSDFPPQSGSFDGSWETIVREFQGDCGLDVDAVVGPMTWRAITLSTAYSNPQGGRKLLRYQNAIFSIPVNWRARIGGGPLGMGQLEASLIVSRSAGPIDDHPPQGCRDGQPGSTTLAESGFAPIGDRTAEFRRWEIACADGSVESRRRWLLPQSQVDISERFHDPENLTVVATGQVAPRTN
jgi:hypothetical protein